MIRFNQIIKFCLVLTCICTFLDGITGQELQQLSLKEAYDLLENRYPVLQNGDLMTTIHQKELDKLDIEKLPTITWFADGRVQSESTSLDTEGGSLPFEIDQPIVSVKSFVEADYTLVDGGINTAKKKLKTVQLAVDEQNLLVERYALKERVNQLFINILILREQQKLLDFSLDDLRVRKERIAAGVEMGTLLESEMAKVEVKILELRSHQTDLSFKVKGFIGVLEQLTGAQIAENVSLLLPSLPELDIVPEINRPEQQLFQLQRSSILAQSDMIEAVKRPKLSAYAQAGVGYPNPLNILDNNIALYGIIGVRFSWQLTDWKKSKIEKELLSLQAEKVSNAQATLEFNLESQKANYLAEVKRLKAQIKQDENIAVLQQQILQQLAAQLDEGVITSSEYITQVNVELAARQNLAIHQTELIKAQIEFLNERGTL